MPPQHHAAASEASTAQHAEGRHAESGAPGENSGGSVGAAGENGHGAEGSAKHAVEHSSETLLGINPEVTGLVVVAVALSLVLAALILTVGWPCSQQGSRWQCWRSPHWTSAK